MSNMPMLGAAIPVQELEQHVDWLVDGGRDLELQSFHSAEVEDLAQRYQALNVKLDKQGGLTGALRAIERAEALGLDVFLGSMVCTSLAIAPAALLASRARWVDLDGATFLAADRPDAMTAVDGVLAPPTSALWG